MYYQDVLTTLILVKIESENRLKCSELLSTYGYDIFFVDGVYIIYNLRCSLRVLYQYIRLQRLSKDEVLFHRIEYVLEVQPPYITMNINLLS